MPAPRPTFERVPARQPDVFLSHSSKDKQFVRPLAKDLSSVGVDVWFDDWEIEVGDSLHKSIGRGLEKSRFVAVIISARSTNSDWCKDEIDTALAYERAVNMKRVLPLLYESADVPAFLNGRAYQDMRAQNYFPGLTFLAGLVHGFSKQALSDAVDHVAPQDLNAVGDILRDMGWSGRFYIDPMRYEQHERLIFDYSGRRLADLYLDDEYHDLIAQMQRDGVNIVPLRWPI